MARSWQCMRVNSLEEKKMSNENNVIEFPKKPETEPAKPQKMSALSFDLENRKVMISGSIASILVVMTLLNSALFTDPSQVEQVGTQNGRSIASVGEVHRNTNWEHQLAKTLNKKVKRGIASIGRSPSQQEKFRIGELEGKYSVSFSGDALRSVRFVAGIQSSEEPKYIIDRHEFLKRHRDLLPIEFKKVSLQRSEAQKNGQNEVYRLVGTDETKHVDVQFELDQHDRLISMQVIN